MSSQNRKLLSLRNVILLGLIVAGLSYGGAVYHFLAQTPDFGWILDPQRKIGWINEGGSASQAGLQVGDQIVAVGGEPILSAPSYFETVRRHRVLGVEVPIEVVREEVNLGYTLVAQPHAFSKNSRCSFLVVVLSLLLALFILFKKPTEKAAFLFSLILVTGSVLRIGFGHLWYLLEQPFLSVVWVLAGLAVVPLSLHFACIFPRERRLLTRKKYLYPLLYLPSVVLSLVGLVLYHQALAVDPLKGDEHLVFQRIFRLGIGFQLYYQSYLLTVFGLFLLSFFRSPAVRERKQLVWIVAALLFAVCNQTYLFFQFQAHPSPSHLLFTLQDLTPLPMVFLWPFAIALSIFKYRLLDIDRIISRGMAYLMVSAISVALYLGFVGGFSGSLGQVIDFSSWGLVGATLVIALLFFPIKQKIQKVIDRHFYRDRYRYQNTIYELSQRLTTFLKEEPLFQTINETLQKAFPISHVTTHVCSKEEDPSSFHALHEFLPKYPKAISRFEIENQSLFASQRETLLSQMDSLGAELLLPFFYERKLRGWIVLGEREDGDVYSTTDIELLTTLADQVAVALQNASSYQQIERLNEDLREKVQKIEVLQEKLFQENASLKQEIQQQSHFWEIVGTSFAMREVFQKVQKIASTSSSVFIHGESGTGKELIASAIHYNSSRKDKPFIKVNCAALPEGTLESELFGHERGAFTGAVARRQGRFELADSGTLFLDEIGEIPAHMQLRLLRVLQEKQFERVGGTQTLETDVRVIAATNRDLEEAVAEGRFREDLYFRLNVISIEIPPLRERMEDLYPLALHFIEKYNRQTGKAFCKITEDGWDVLKRYHWPGNVRELENLIHRAIVLGEGEELTLKDLSSGLNTERSEGFDAREEAPHPLNYEGLFHLPYWDQIRYYEKIILQEALKKTGGIKERTARSLGISRSHFFRKLKEHGFLS
ncbi:MAG: sigma 54-interacting transcriptional regulator [Deltaproteobacteria bacterium]|nr:sigma 54-interacting transcriptional regulator [Deltaproteobacteria bacterium]